MTTLASTPAARGHRDVASDVATALVVATAVVSSWAGWVLLATATDFGQLGGVQLAWLLPITVDAYAFVAARAWRTGQSRVTRRYGLWSGVAALGLSIAGNAAGHAAHAGVWQPGWVAVVTVAMIPPTVLFAALLLATMAGRDRRAEEDKAAAREARGGGQRRAPAPATTEPASGQVTPLRPKRSAPATSAAATHDAYNTAVARGHAAGPRTVATYQMLAGVLDVSERTIRRHMASYPPRPAEGVASGQ